MKDRQAKKDKREEKIYRKGLRPLYYRKGLYPLYLPHRKGLQPLYLYAPPLSPSCKKDK
jgi:hypothetical protein